MPKRRTNPFKAQKDKIKIPKFQGTTDTKLAKLHNWAALHHPGRQFSLEEIGQAIGITRERVRQIQNRALRKLRHPARLQILSREDLDHLANGSRPPHYNQTAPLPYPQAHTHEEKEPPPQKVTF